MRVTGLSSAELSALAGDSRDEEAWHPLMSVTVTGTSGIAVAGRYGVDDGALVFTPRFPFDPGRKYTVRFDPRRLPTARADPMVETVLALPGPAASARVSVTAIAPSADIWPANMLRFYIHFSGPMSSQSGVGFVKLRDASGREIKNALLPSPIDFWNPDRTRYTVFFEPGRVKRGILPNLMEGRALQAGQRYTVTVDPGWRDARGRPLASGYSRSFTAGPPMERALSLADWRVVPPRGGSIDALRVGFPHPLDQGLLVRAIEVTGPDGKPVAGKVDIGGGESEWRFVPARPWRPGKHSLRIQSILEDPAGNRINVAFETIKLPGDVPDYFILPLLIE